MPKDILYDCAKAYKKLLDYEYVIKVQENKIIKDITITFDVSSFKHLLGIHKLIDMPLYANMASGTFYNNVLNGSICFSDISKSVYFNTPLIHSEQSKVDYYITDRILELTYLQDYFKKFKTHFRGLFKWEKNVNINKRPRHSDISADALIVFALKYNQKVNNELTCAFFIESAVQNNYSAVSIFPTDVSYSDDGRIKLSECKILSADEICKSTGTVTHLIECDPGELQRAKEAALRKDQSITIANDLKALKNKRRAYMENPANLSAEAAYKKKLAIYKNANIYTDDMLRIVIERLEAQQKDSHNAENVPYIQNEIKFLKGELEERDKRVVGNGSPKSVSIVLNQTNADGTLSKNTVAEIPVPKAFDDIQRKTERDVHTVTGGIQSLLLGIKEKLKSVFHNKTDKKSDSSYKSNEPEEDVQNAPQNEEQTNEELSGSEPEKEEKAIVQEAPKPEVKEKTYDFPVSKELAELFEVREKFADGVLSLDEYKQTFLKYLRTLHGERMWREAADMLSKQLTDCPEKLKQPITYEIHNINENIKRNFPSALPASQKFQSMAEIKEFARQKCIEYNNARRQSEQENPRDNDRSRNDTYSR